jgi:hypothetical protein
MGTKTSDGFPNPSFGGKGPFAKGLSLVKTDNDHRAYAKSTIAAARKVDKSPPAQGLAASMKIARQKCEKDSERKRLGGGD